jgi:hypothetical protein
MLPPCHSCERIFIDLLIPVKRSSFFAEFILLRGIMLRIQVMVGDEYGKKMGLKLGGVRKGKG